MDDKMKDGEMTLCLECGHIVPKGQREACGGPWALCPACSEREGHEVWSRLWDSEEVRADREAVARRRVDGLDCIPD